MKKILLVGNPNVGKSTVFNKLTGENQHTGNWIGKTVDLAKGYFKYKDEEYEIYDLPGTYSLNTHSKEEEVTRDAIYYEDYDLIVLVVEASAFERNLNLVLQILEVNSNIVLCCNLMDEAKKQGISIDKEKLSQDLGIDVVLTSARNNEGIEELLESIYSQAQVKSNNQFKITYSSEIEDGISLISERLENTKLNKRFIAIKLLTNKDVLEVDNEKINNIVKLVQNDLKSKGLNIEDIISYGYQDIQKKIIGECFKQENKSNKLFNIDKLLTNRVTGIFIMILLLMIIFFITIVLSNYPSDLLFFCFSKVEEVLLNLFLFLKVPDVITSVLIFGIFRTLSFVVSVMLPPMAIFFPMFSLLEDLGYLPRVAFNMDGIFEKCGACGKQSLTMMMGFGCNAVGVTSSRIIDSKRERLLAILTNNFVPCNGRFPMLITLIGMLLIGRNSTILEVLILTLFIGLSVLMTFLVSLILSKTILKGERSSFTLELPNFRRPNVIKVIVRSFKDKTLHILKRAVLVCIPAGFIIWILSNIMIGNSSILIHISNFLNPIGKLLGIDGTILSAFILGFPANEIVIPIMAMIYMNQGIMSDGYQVIELYNLFVNNGWSFIILICTCIFTLFHFPCSTTVFTIYYETKSKIWTFLSFLLPTICGVILCFITNFILRLIFY